MADASKRRRWNIEVTEEDIAKAIQNDSYKCVVAQAIARGIPDATKIEVDVQTIRFSREGERLTYLTPYSVAGYVVAFDAGDEIHPFEFHLRDPQIKPSRTKTAAGKQVAQKKDRVKTLQQRATKAERTLANPDATKPERAKAEAILEEAPAQIDEAKADLDAIRAAHKEAGVQMQEDKGRRPPPKVYKKKTRAYGQRILRVNQAPDRKHYA